MSFLHHFRNSSENLPLTRRQALTALALLALTACRRSPSRAESAGKPIAYYTCTMHPFVRSQDPKGTCPVCGMNLVAVLKSSTAADASARIAYIAPERLEEIGARSEGVTIQSANQSLLIPARAVLPTGNKYIVFVDHGEGQVEPREIEAKSLPDTQYEIIFGLRKEDLIFVTALFLIDAECRIQGVLKTWGDR